MALWNLRYLPPPPTFTLQVKGIDVTPLVRTLTAAEHMLSNTELDYEAAIISRIIYKKKKSFRMFKGFSALQKVNRILLRYLLLDLRNIYNRTLDSLRAAYGPKPYVITRQMLEYVLVRTLTFVLLMKKLKDTCKQAACLSKQTIAVGHVWEDFLIMYALLARIWKISSDLMDLSAAWYEMLKPCIAILPAGRQEWFEEKFDFPDDLKLWINKNDFGFCGREFDSKQENKETHNKATSEDDFAPEEIPVADTVEECKTALFNENTPNNSRINVQQREDIGVVITRSNFEGPKILIQKKVDRSVLFNKSNEDCNSKLLAAPVVKKKKKIMKENTKMKNIDQIVSHKDLVKFMKRESKYRLKNKHKAITANISDEDFSDLIEVLEAYCKMLSKKKMDKKPKKYKRIIEEAKGYAQGVLL